MPHISMQISKPRRVNLTQKINNSKERIRILANLLKMEKSSRPTLIKRKLKGTKSQLRLLIRMTIIMSCSKKMSVLKQKLQP